MYLEEQKDYLLFNLIYLSSIFFLAVFMSIVDTIFRLIYLVLFVLHEGIS